MHETLTLGQEPQGWCACGPSLSHAWTFLKLMLFPNTERICMPLLGAVVSSQGPHRPQTRDRPSRASAGRAGAVVAGSENAGVRN